MKLVLFLVALSATLSAQNITQPPPILRIFQTAPNQHPTQADPSNGVFLFALSSFTGQPESWAIETHDSFASIEQLDAAANRAPAAESSRTLIATHRANWSYRPDEAALALRKARYIQVSLYRAGYGAESEFAELLAARRANLDNMNLDRPNMVYHVVAGANSGTYIVLSPLPSLAALDESVKRVSRPANSRTPAEISHEGILFRIDPTRSHVSNEFAESNTSFWRSR